MSFIQVSTSSKALARANTFNIYMPDDLPALMTEGNHHYARSMKTLFLLHGYSGNMHDWLVGGNIQDIAAKYNLAIVMPNCGNTFYLNGKGTGNKYADYVGIELVEYMRKTFSLARNRDETLIGGLSMGGFGALHTGLQYPDNFGKIMALSSALIIHELKDMTPKMQNGMADYDYYVNVFGELDKVEDSDKNPEYLIRKLKEKEATIPDIYMACGTEDFLLMHNRHMRNFLMQEQVPVMYEEGPGVHDWKFWNQYLEPAVCFMLGK